MPGKYVVRRKKTRSRRKKFYRRSKPRLPIGGFPTRKLAKLRYVQTVTLNAGAGTYAVNEFRANSLYDPDKTGTGHQPSNFDKLATIYDRYTVLGARCVVYWVPISNTALTYSPTVVLHLSEDGGEIAEAHGSGGINNILEQPRLRSSINFMGDPTARTRPLVKTFSAKKFFGVNTLVGETPYSADILANPSEGAFFEVAAISPDDSSAPGAITLRVMIDYIAMFTEPKIADAS